MKTIRFQPHHWLRIAQSGLAILVAVVPLVYAIFSDLGDPRSDPLMWGAIYLLYAVGFALLALSMHNSKRRPTILEAAQESEAIRFAVEVADRLNVGFTCVKFTDDAKTCWRVSTLFVPQKLVRDSDLSVLEASIAYAFALGAYRGRNHLLFSPPFR